MGFASFLEDITDRRNEDTFLTWKRYVGANPHERDIREARDVLGDPFEYPRTLIRQFQLHYDRSPRVDMRESPWTSHIENLSGLREILLPLNTIRENDAQAWPQVQSAASVLNVFFNRVQQFGPLSRKIMRRVSRRSAEIIRYGRQVRTVIRDFLRTANGMSSLDRDKRDLRQELASLDKILQPLETDLEILDEYADLTQEVERLWQRFLRLHRTLPVQMSFRPVLQELNRLTLNEEQERFVALNLKGCYRIQGVSGSGKTIILAHRALRLAMEDQSATVRVFTVNRTLAVLLHSTIAALRGGKIPPNVRVHCIYDFLIDCIRLFTRIDRFRLLDDKSGEKIEISWRDFFEHAGQDPRRHVFAKPEVAALVGAIQRRIGVDRHDAGQYLREEMIYIQSACSAAERGKYLSDSRSGRSIALGRRQRESCLKVVDAWEDYLLTGGLCDVHGVSLSAAEYFLDSVRLCKIKRTFRTDHLLIDEVQDCSTLELRLLRSLISRPNGSNAFFFAGDINQKIYAKHLNNVAAGYDFKGRSAILAQNYRNTRQILRAAFCLPEAFPPPLDAEFEVVRPEYSNYEGGRPIVFDCTNADQLQCIMEVVRLRVKSRLAVVSENDELLQRIRMVALERGYRIYDLLRNEDLDRWRTQADDPLLATLALGRMAAVKGFEFDTLIAADLSDGIVPSPGVPIEDRWREAAIVYGALTRARDELVLTFEGKPSVFVTIMQDQIDMMEGLDEAIARRILE